MMLKTLIGFIVFLLTALFPYSVNAASAAKISGITAQPIASGLAVDLNFDRPVSSKSLKPTYERNFIQFVLHATKMDSAHIVPTAFEDIQKVFAYPYNADTVRLRVITQGSSSAPGHKHKISLWNNNPRSVRILVRGLTKQAPQVAQVVQTPHATVSGIQKETETPEPALISEVVSNTKDIDIHDPESIKAALNTKSNSHAEGAAGPVMPAIKKESIGRPEAAPAESGSVGIKSEPSKYFVRMAVALLGILALFIGVVFLVKRYAGKLKKLPFGKKERLIQVIATHYLGNKKSISLIKVTGEYMVVGTSNEGVSLISKLGPEVNVDKYLEDRFWGGTFEKHLNSYAGDAKSAKDEIGEIAPKPALTARRDTDRVITQDEFYKDDEPETTISSPAAQLSEKVTDKVELSPVRQSIRDKITKLKPLA